MKKIIFLLTALMTANLHAEETCFLHPTDPFNVSLRFTEGKHKGSCIYTEVRRNAHILNPQVAADTYRITPSPDRVLVTNFRHNNRFWIASIPTSKIVKTYVQAFELMGPFTHLQFRFILDEGDSVELYPQDLSETRRVEKIKDFVFALHALRAIEEKDAGYSPFGEGMNDGYGVAYNMRSTEQDVEDISKSGKAVHQYQLKFSQKQQTQLFWDRLNVADKTKESDIYNTTTRSCVTATLEGIYNIVPDKFVLWLSCPRQYTLNLCVDRNLTGALERFGFKTPFNPAAAVDRLRKQGYIGDKKIPDLRSEFIN